MQCMAQEGSEASVASSPPPQTPPSASSWWRDMQHPAAYGAWPPSPAARWPPPVSMAPAATTQQQQQHGGRATTSSDGLSASNATVASFTNHSGLSLDSAGGAEAAAAAAAAAESHLWNQVLIMGAGGEVGRSMQAVHDAHDDSENFLDLLNSRALAPELFAEPPACDYLKKMEYGGGSGGWPDHNFTTSALEKHLGSGYGAPERLTANLSDLVSNWSIAPPSPCLGDARHHRVAVAGAGACDNNNAAVAALGLGGKAAAGLFLDSGGVGVCNSKHEIGGHGAMLEEAAAASGGSGQELLRPAGYSSMLGLSSSSRMYMDVPWGNNASRSLSDLISFGGTPLGKPEQPTPAATSTKAQAAEYKKQGREISSPPKTSSEGGSKGSSDGKKKKRSDGRQGSEANAKKSKNEASSPTSSSLKASQLPKVKLGDKITALQQIVSPFGKTDTASVLYEAINYIKWLHEQVQVITWASTRTAYMYS
ncbi:basic helix-loop-helix (bHLH) DNA-binding superfamily protein [Zea mays]|uniref:Basic helix-loop-helix (BHLH) DNA-binding superfamily protein n=1 Tax=Zea mays TaxID=4577 RepID=A0A1D6IAA6_MAIZE|nr:basic helix-loop-helix (bHLH) DNA-binding superfamily protein [Zea mays]